MSMPVSTAENGGPTVSSVQVGRTAPLGPQGVPSGFVKGPVSGPVEVRTLGLQGDEQADLRVHGGLEKAVYGYAASRYAEWKADFPEHAELFVPGAFGENLTIFGLQESDICVGDVHEIGTALLQVCQPRQPCFKLALRFADNRLPRAMVSTGRSGWYYRIIREGQLKAGDTVRLIERPNPDLPFETLVRIVNHGDATIDELSRIAHALGVARWLHASAQQALNDPDSGSS